MKTSLSVAVAAACLAAVFAIPANATVSNGAIHQKIDAAS